MPQSKAAIFHRHGSYERALALSASPVGKGRAIMTDGARQSATLRAEKRCQGAQMLLQKLDLDIPGQRRLLLRSAASSEDRAMPRSPGFPARPSASTGVLGMTKNYERDVIRL